MPTLRLSTFAICGLLLGASLLTGAEAPAVATPSFTAIPAGPAAAVYEAASLAKVGGFIDIPAGVLGAAALSKAEVLAVWDTTTGKVPAGLAVMRNGELPHKTEQGAVIGSDAHLPQTTHPFSGMNEPTRFFGPQYSEKWGVPFDYAVGGGHGCALALRGDAPALWQADGRPPNGSAKFHGWCINAIKSSAADGKSGVFHTLGLFRNEKTGTESWKSFGFATAAKGPPLIFPRTLSAEGFTHLLKVVQFRSGDMAYDALDPRTWPDTPKLLRSQLKIHHALKSVEELPKFITELTDANWDALHGAPSEADDRILNVALAEGHYRNSPAQPGFAFSAKEMAALARLSGGRQLRLVGKPGKTSFDGLYLFNPEGKDLVMPEGVLRLAFITVRHQSLEGFSLQYVQSLVSVAPCAAIAFEGCILDTEDGHVQDDFAPNTSGLNAAKIAIRDSLILGGQRGGSNWGPSVGPGVRWDIQRLINFVTSDGFYASGQLYGRITNSHFISGGGVVMQPWYRKNGYDFPTGTHYHDDHIQIQVRWPKPNDEVRMLFRDSVFDEPWQSQFNDQGSVSVTVTDGAFPAFEMNGLLLSTSGATFQVLPNFPDSEEGERATNAAVANTVVVPRLELMSDPAALPVRNMGQLSAATKASAPSDGVRAWSLLTENQNYKIQDGWRAAVEFAPDMRTGPRALVPTAEEAFASPITYSGDRLSGYVADYGATTYHGSIWEGFIAAADYAAKAPVASYGGAKLLPTAEDQKGHYITLPKTQAELLAHLGYDLADHGLTTFRLGEYRPEEIKELPAPIRNPSPGSHFAFWNLGFSEGTGTLLEEVAEDGSGYRLRLGVDQHATFELWDKTGAIIARTTGKEPVRRELIFQGEFEYWAQAFEDYVACRPALNLIRNWQPGVPERIIHHKQASAPVVKPAAGEHHVWIDSANGNAVKSWDGSAWVIPQGDLSNLYAGLLTTLGAHAVQLGKAGAKGISTSTGRELWRPDVVAFDDGVYTSWLARETVKDGVSSWDFNGGTPAEGDLFLGYRSWDGFMSPPQAYIVAKGNTMAHLGVAAPGLYSRAGYQWTPRGAIRARLRGERGSTQPTQDWLWPLHLSNRSLNVPRGTIYLGRRKDGSEAFSGKLRYAEGRFDNLREPYVNEKILNAFTPQDTSNTPIIGRDLRSPTWWLTLRREPDDVATGARGAMGAPAVWVTSKKSP